MAYPPWMAEVEDVFEQIGPDFRGAAATARDWLGRLTHPDTPKPTIIPTLGHGVMGYGLHVLWDTAGREHDPEALHLLVEISQDGTVRRFSCGVPFGRGLRAWACAAVCCLVGRLN